MKKKVIIAIISVASVATVGIGGFLLGNNSNQKTIDEPVTVEIKEVHMMQALYGCPISKKNKKAKYIKK